MLDGIGTEAFANDLATGIAPGRPVLLFDLDADGYAAVVERGTVQLSRATARLWPFP